MSYDMWLFDAETSYHLHMCCVVLRCIVLVLHTHRDTYRWADAHGFVIQILAYTPIETRIIQAEILLFAMLTKELCLWYKYESTEIWLSIESKYILGWGKYKV